jgi:ABC-type branched-subunit amino acid transport system ATPase component
MNLTYAEQRALEIGITIAGGADVVMLDEPTAGMSKSETARFIELIRDVTVGKTLLTVEHDMGVVFGLADKIAVLVYGEVIAFDLPEAVRANTRRKPDPRLGFGDAQVEAGVRTHAPLTMLLEPTASRPHGKSHILHGVDLPVGEGRDREPAGRKGSGCSTTEGDHGLVAAEGRSGSARRSPATGTNMRTAASACRRIALSSQAHGEPEPAARREAPREEAALDVHDMYRMFPRLKEREHTEAGVLSGGEQQMLTCCAPLMGRPDLIMIDERPEGLAPKTPSRSPST